MEKTKLTKKSWLLIILVIIVGILSLLFSGCTDTENTLPQKEELAENFKQIENMYYKTDTDVDLKVEVLLRRKWKSADRVFQRIELLTVDSIQYIIINSGKEVEIVKHKDLRE